MEIKVLYEDKDIIVVVKPPKISSQPDKTGDTDMVTYLGQYLKKGYVGLVHRLDKPVGGVMVFAKNEKANANLSKQIQQGMFSKQYLAVVCGKPEKQKEKLTDLLWKNERLNMSKVVCKGTSNAKEAVAFAVLANEAMYGQPNNAPGATGAAHPVVMGKISQ